MILWFCYITERNNENLFDKEILGHFQRMQVLSGSFGSWIVTITVCFPFQIALLFSYISPLFEIISMFLSNVSSLTDNLELQRPLVAKMQIR